MRLKKYSGKPLKLWPILLDHYTNAVFSEIDPIEYSESIDILIQGRLQNDCTPKRERMCEILQGYLKGTAPIFKRDQYLFGNINAGDMAFRHTYDFRKTFGVFYIRKTGKNSEASFSELEAENDDEIEQANEYIELLGNGKSVINDDLHGFLINNSKYQKYSQCVTLPEALFCDISTDQQEAAIVKTFESNIYVLVISRVPKMPGSWDSVPGFYISKMSLSK